MENKWWQLLYQLVETKKMMMNSQEHHSFKMIIVCQIMRHWYAREKLYLCVSVRVRVCARARVYVKEVLAVALMKPLPYAGKSYIRAKWRKNSIYKYGKNEGESRGGRERKRERINKYGHKNGTERGEASACHYNAYTLQLLSGFIVRWLNTVTLTHTLTYI